MNKFDVRVEVRGELPKDGIRLKVSIPDLGIYIDGFRGYPSQKVEGTWTIYPPSVRVGGGYKDVVEFNKKKSLWREIAEAGLQTIEIYESAEAKDKPLADVGF